MKRMKTIIIVGGVVVALAAAVGTSLNKASSTRFFADQSFHFQTIRAMNEIAAGGADTGEVLEAVRDVKAGDVQGWFNGWEHAAQRVLKSADAITDTRSKGLAYLRAHNYLRTAEFFLHPDDPKRTASFVQNVQLFYKGLDTLGVRYEKIVVPYQGHHLNAVYYPAANKSNKPLILLSGGYDSTLEELYFVLVEEANRRGYDVLTFEGPGQGSVLREQKLTFTSEWEKPTSAVLDTFLANHQPNKIVSVGMSLGGYLAPRAAAFDSRIDGVVAYDVLFDFGEVARLTLPAPVRWMHAHGWDAPVEALVKLKSAFSPGFRWAIDNGKWVMGTPSAMDTFDAMQAYTLAPVADRIRGDVLILAGAEDHFIPVKQVEDFKQALTNARSVTTHIYSRESGGAEHGQLGANTLWHADFFTWVEQRFSLSPASPASEP